MAKFIAPVENTDSCGMYEFIKNVYIKRGEKVRIRIFASSLYTLYINGEYICEGPCKSAEHIRYYDEISTMAFEDGLNEIRVEVMHLTDSRSLSAIFKTPKPILLFEAVSDGVYIISDSSWKCIINKRYEFLTFDWAPFVPPNEIINMNGTQTALQVKEEAETDFKTFYNSNGIAEYFCLEPRPIPMIYPQQAQPLAIVREGDGFAELDAGEYVTANVTAEIKRHSTVKIIYSECYETKSGKNRRDKAEGYLKGVYDTIITGDDDYIFTTYRFRSFRFIRIECENPKETIKNIYFNKCHYPLEISGSFNCSENKLNKIFDISINTMLCCLHETFVDCPYYEQQQYVMDSAIEAAVLMRISKDLRLIRKCISEFASAQRRDGLIPANYPCGYTQIIPGFSLFWIFMLRDYLEYTHDIDFVYEYTGTADRILTYFEKNVRENGLICGSEYWDYADWVPGWENGVPISSSEEAITIYNMYYAYALKCAEEICSRVGRYGLAGEYKERYMSLKRKITAECYNDKKGLYKDGSCTERYSMHTIIWAVLSEIVTGAEARNMLLRLDEKHLSKSSFSMNYYLFRALEKADCYDRAMNYMTGWKRMVDLGCTTWCENPVNPRSECHAWSCAPIYEFSTHILGVNSLYEDEIVIKPYTMGLAYANGKVPTRFGMVEVSWEKEDNKFSISVNAPDKIRKKVVLPNGCTEEFTGMNAKFRI